ncbi:MAG: hypothetical protein ACYDCS_05765 [Candidatus Dormibacteria bacterium]
MTQMGLLAALMEPAASQEDEFNEWYDNEHLTHMQGVAGVLTATRFVAVEGWPRYLALYDLDALATLQSDSYRSVTGGSFSPWSRRLLRDVRGWHRLSFEQRMPGRGTIDSACHALAMFLFSGSTAAESAAAALQSPRGMLQTRAFSPAADGPSLLLVESGSLASLPGLDLVASGVPADVARVSTWAARLVRYARNDPLAAFRHLEATGSA